MPGSVGERPACHAGARSGAGQLRVGVRRGEEPDHRGRAPGEPGLGQREPLGPRVARVLTDGGTVAGGAARDSDHMCPPAGVEAGYAGDRLWCEPYAVGLAEDERLLMLVIV